MLLPPRENTFQRRWLLSVVVCFNLHTNRKIRHSSLLNVQPAHVDWQSSIINVQNITSSIRPCVHNRKSFTCAGREYTLQRLGRLSSASSARGPSLFAAFDPWSSQGRQYAPDTTPSRGCQKPSGFVALLSLLSFSPATYKRIGRGRSRETGDVAPNQTCRNSSHACCLSWLFSRLCPYKRNPVSSRYINWISNPSPRIGKRPPSCKLTNVAIIHYL